LIKFHPKSRAATSGAFCNRLVAMLAAFALLSVSMPGLAAADAYHLGTMDKLRIRVVEWQTAEGSVRDWSSISGDYTVGPSGNISLPFIGELEATGKTTADIASEIGEGLQQKFALSDKPEASVELAEFRPLFVSGDVQTPGKYPYNPGLTVLQAVSVAGGIRRASDLGQRFERDFINARGNYDVLVKQRDGLVAKHARLMAEAAGKTEIGEIEALKNSPDRDTLIEDETSFMIARKKRHEEQLKAIDDLKNLLQSEISSLEKKIASQDRQAELSRKELASIGNLADRGLVVNQRVLSIERSISELEGKVLDMETASLRAKQDISKATQDASNLISERTTGIAQERQQSEAEIAQLNLKIAMYRDLMGEVVAKAPEAAANSATSQPNVNYSIVRTKDGKPSEIQADENTPVLPGDVVKIGIVPVPVQ
jgi:exopolysaccharide production protein ExoF